MKYAIGFFFGIVLTTLFFSWYIRRLQLHQPASAETVVSTNAPTQAQASEDFDTFYQKFHQDSAFQITHVLFPLEGVAARDSSYVVSDVPFRWQKENWVLHREFNDMDGAFKRDFISMGDDLMIENIKHVNGRYGMQRRYAKYEDGWYLIYYAAMNELAPANVEETAEGEE